MPLIIDLQALDGITGFGLDGYDSQAGYSVDVVGDVNGDGFADLLIGGPGFQNGDANESGEAYVVFGQAAGFPAQLDLGTLNGSNGFRLQNYDIGGRAGFSVSGAGDINGDGFADLIIGAPDNYAEGVNDSGQAFVFFGRDDNINGFAATIDLTALAATEGGNLVGGNVIGDDLGGSVSGIGDINGDGFDDVIVGGPGFGAGAGSSFVLFGSAAGVTPPVDLTLLNGADGFRIDGIDVGDVSAASVSGLGDVNGDGVDDFIIGAPNADPGGRVDAGESYVIFGQTAPFAATFDLNGLNGGNGFRIEGVAVGAYSADNAGASVGDAGDVNGDGFADIIVGAPGADVGGGAYYGYDAGQAYVLFGTDAGFAASVQLAALNGADGFSISSAGVAFEDRYGAVGSAVAGAGDVNGDGFDDVIIGAPGRSFDDGRGFIVFGAATFGADFDLGGLAADTGSNLIGNIFQGQIGAAVGGGSDFNGDGLADVTVGAPGADYDVGEAFLVRGFDSGAITQFGTAGDDVLAGSAAADIVIGDLGDDVFDGLGGADVINGGAGDDTAIVADLAFQRIDGGTGTDTLNLAGAGLALDFSAAGDQKVRDVEAIDLSGAGTSVTFDTLSVQQISDTSNKVTVTGDATSSLILADEVNWTAVKASNAFVTLQSGQAEIDVSVDINFSPVFANLAVSTIELSALDGADGFRIEGIGNGSYFGNFVSDAGDVNGDGFDDFIVGAPEDGRDFFRGGEAFVVFGDGGASPAAILAADLDGTDGFRISPEFAYGYTGLTVGAAGDVNGDGFADIAVGGFGGDSFYGETHVIFGTDAGFAADIAVGALNGADGFSISGIATGDRAGVIDGAGDFNGDGFNDLIVGASDASPYGRGQAGETYIVYGDDQGFAANVDLASLDANTGFRIAGAAASGDSGRTVSSAGDINGDGFADIVIGAPGLNESIVVFGRASGVNLNLDLLGLAAADGFKIIGANSGFAVNHAGDINGDGFGDFIIADSGANPGGAYEGSAFVVFGSAAAFGTTLDVNGLNGANGFRIDGINADGRLGSSVAGAGDVNGDGFDDLLIGAGGTSGDGGAYQGQSVVVFGQAAGFGAVFDPNTVDGYNGFLINDAEAGDYSGTSVSSAGDLNGDGFDDLLVGAPLGDAGGVQVGESYVIFGADTGDVTQLGDAGANTLVGATVIDVLVGGQGDDTLIGGGDADVLRGGEGDDILDVLDVGFARVVGGSGTDTLRISGDGELLDLTALGDQGVSEIEAIDLAGTTVTLDISTIALLNLSDTSNTLTLTGGADDVLILRDAGWVTVANDGAIVTLENGAATLVFDADIVASLDVNTDPVAAADDIVVDEDLSVSGDVLADNGNGVDADADGDFLLVNAIPVVDVANGVLILNDDGTFDYTPDADFNGTDSFQYEIDDGKGGTAVGTVSITVNPVNDDPVGVDDDFTTDQNTVLVVNVLDDNGGGADFDIDGDTVFVDSFDATGTVGLVSLLADGTLTYDPNGQFDDLRVGEQATDTFTYVNEDLNGGFGGARVTITITGVNDDPIAQDDFFATNEDIALAGDVLDDNGLGFDNDVDGDVLTVNTTPVSDVANGTLVLNGDGTFIYTPDPDFNGIDGFEYEVLDGNGGSDIGLVEINVDPVNDDPVARDDDVETLENVTLNGDVLADNGNGADFDVDLDSLTVNASPVVDVVNGVLILNGDGTFTYTPDVNFSGVDSFEYELLDGVGGTATGVVTINVIGVNEDPVAADDNITVIAGKEILGNLLDDNGGGVDIDPNAGDVLSTALDTAPIQGGVVILANGDFAYLADEDAVGTDSFTYVLSDGAGGQDIGVVNVTINPDPTALTNTAANDVFDGDGTTTVTYEGAGNRIFADMGDGFVSGNGIGVDKVNRIFEVIATDFDDILFGSDVGPGGAGAYILLDAFESFAGLGGSDIIFGADGLDRASYGRAPSGVQVDLVAGLATDDGFGAEDTLFSIEGVKGTNFDDVLLGDDADNFFQPLRGQDFVDGRGGVDLLIYEGLAANIAIDLKGGSVVFGNGDETTIASIENVETDVGAQDIMGSGFANKIAAGDGDDRLIGLAGNDSLFGEDGDDQIFGNSGDDVLDGGLGNDALSGAGGADNILGKGGDDVMRGGNGGDRIVGYSGRDFLAGEAGNDRLYGNSGDDLISGGAGRDCLSGGGGDDFIGGDAGNDVMRGGANDDIFVFDVGPDIDTILDFEVGRDLLDVSRLGFVEFAEIDAILADINGRAQINFNGNADVLRLNGVAAAELSDADFIFA